MSSSSVRPGTGRLVHILQRESGAERCWRSPVLGDTERTPPRCRLPPPGRRWPHSQARPRQLHVTLPRSRPRRPARSPHGGPCPLIAGSPEKHHVQACRAAQTQRCSGLPGRRQAIETRAPLDTPSELEPLCVYCANSWNKTRANRYWRRWPGFGAGVNMSLRAEHQYAVQPRGAPQAYDGHLTPTRVRGARLPGQHDRRRR